MGAGVPLGLECPCGGASQDWSDMHGQLNSAIDTSWCEAAEQGITLGEWWALHKGACGRRGYKKHQTPFRVRARLIGCG